MNSLADFILKIIVKANPQTHTPKTPKTQITFFSASLSCYL